MAGELQSEIAQAEQTLESFAAEYARITAKRIDYLKELRTLLGTESIEDAEFDWEKQCARVLATLEKFQFSLETKPTPQSVQSAFSLEKRATIRTLREPTLILVPEVTENPAENFAALVQAINESGFAPVDTYVNEDVFGSIGKKSLKPQQRKVLSFEPRIIEGMREMNVEAKDNHKDILRNRIPAARARRLEHQEGTDRSRYAMLMMQSLTDGKPIDAKGWTILDDDPALEGVVVPGAFWFDGQVGFGGSLAGDADGDGRFRRSVGGDVLRS